MSSGPLLPPSPASFCPAGSSLGLRGGQEGEGPTTPKHRAPEDAAWRGGRVRLAQCARTHALSEWKGPRQEASGRARPQILEKWCRCRLLLRPLRGHLVLVLTDACGDTAWLRVLWVCAAVNGGLSSVGVASRTPLEGEPASAAQPCAPTPAPPARLS